jgi:hypothetical protein
LSAGAEMTGNSFRQLSGGEGQTAKENGVKQYQPNDGRSEGFHKHSFYNHH